MPVDIVAARLHRRHQQLPRTVDSYSPSLGAIVSRRFGDRCAFYVEPIWVNNTQRQPKELADHNDTFMVGLGARIRIRPTVYLVGEITPRVAGLQAGHEPRQLRDRKARRRAHVPAEFLERLGTTTGQIARGAFNSDDWYMGFNISRKFY